MRMSQISHPPLTPPARLVLAGGPRARYLYRLRPPGGTRHTGAGLCNQSRTSWYPEWVRGQGMMASILIPIPKLSLKFVIDNKVWELWSPWSTRHLINWFDYVLQLNSSSVTSFASFAELSLLSNTDYLTQGLQFIDKLNWNSCRVQS